MVFVVSVCSSFISIPGFVIRLGISVAQGCKKMRQKVSLIMYVFNTHERARTSLVKSMSSIVIVWVPLEPAGLEAGENMEQTLDPSMHASSLVATNPRKLNYGTTSAL